MKVDLNRSSNAARTIARYHLDRNLQDDYDVDRRVVLGKGYAGQVVLCRGKADKKKYALKTFSKPKAKTQSFELLSSEVQVYLSLDHPHIARLMDVYEDAKSVYLVMEYCAGGELYERLAQKKVFSDEDASKATKQMLSAICYLHAHNVVHRDIKLENFLYESNEEDSPLKLIDFGFAKFWDPSTKMTASCGSLAYVSPDVLLKNGYGDKTDLWSMGVIVFMLLAGYPPFHGSDQDMMKSIKAAKPDWIERRWTKVSLPARDFVEKLLSKDPCDRPSAKEALQHHWLQAQEDTTSFKLGPEVLRSFQLYSHSSRLRRAVLQMLTQELAPEETKELSGMFLTLDSSNEGVIKLDDLKTAIRSSKHDGNERFHAVPNQQDDLSPKTPASRLRRSTSEKILNLFSLLDTNGDQQVYYSDFLAAAMEMRAPLREEAVRATFHRLDVDHSGQITANDLRTVLGDHFEGVGVEGIIQEVVSPSAGGKISFHDFMKCLECRDELPTPKARRALSRTCLSTSDAVELDDILPKIKSHCQEPKIETVQQRCFC